MSDIPVCFAGSHATASAVTTNVITVGSAQDGSPACFPVVAGETIIVCGGAGTHLPTGITDTGVNTGYAQAAGTATSPASWIWTAQAAHALHAAGSGFSSDSVTISYSGTGDGKQAVALSVPGLLASPVDSGSAATNSGSSLAPTVTSGALAQARELVVAVCVSTQSAGEAVWPAPWQVIAKNVQTGAQAYCSVAVLRNYTGTGAVTASPTLPGTPGNWTMSICGFKAAAASLKHWVGASVSSFSFADRPGSWGAALEWDTDMGRAPCAQRARVFYLHEWPVQTWGTTAANDPQSVATLCTAHTSLKPIVCLKPARMGLYQTATATSEIASMCAYITMLRNNGVTDLRFNLWNEAPYGGKHSSFGDGTTPNDPFNEQANNPWKAGGVDPPPATGWSDGQAAGHYQAWCALYNPPLLLSGGLSCYKPLIASPIASVLFFPGRAWGTGPQGNNTAGCNEIILDIYASQPFKDPVGQMPGDVETLTRGTLGTYQGTNMNFAPPMGFGFGEIGVTSGTIPDDTVPGWTAKCFTNVSATSFGGHKLPVPGITKVMTDRIAAGFPLAPMVWFSEKQAPAGNAIDSQGRIDGRADIGDAWRDFYDKLSVDAATTGTPPSVSTTSLPAGQVGVPYSFQMQPTGGTAPYTWAVTTGALPAGLTLHSSGLINGTPTIAGAPSIGFQVTDAAALTGSATLTLTVAGAQLTVPPQTIPGATIGVPFAYQLGATGGTPPDSWAVTSGTLPAGLTVTSGGLISGTPTTAGTSTPTVQVTDHLAATASRQITLVVAAPVYHIVTTALPGAVIGQSYTGEVDTAGGVAPDTAWAVISGALPPGLSLASAAAADFHLLDESGSQITDEGNSPVTDESGP